MPCSSGGAPLIELIESLFPFYYIYVAQFDSFGEAFFDFSVINILCPGNLSSAAKGQLLGSELRFKHKHKRYPLLKSQLKPLVVECTGGWNPKSLEYLTDMAELIGSRTNVKASLVLNNLLTTISVCLQRNQGTMVVRRCLGLA